MPIRVSLQLFPKYISCQWIFRQLYCRCAQKTVYEYLHTVCYSKAKLKFVDKICRSFLIINFIKNINSVGLGTDKGTERHDDANGEIFAKHCCEWAKICENVNRICRVHSDNHRQVLMNAITGRQVSPEKETLLSNWATITFSTELDTRSTDKVRNCMIRKLNIKFIYSLYAS